MNPLLSLNDLGQFVWLDAISRDLIVSGKLARFIEEDGVGGITSNPAIFDKAITSGHDYDATIRRALNGDSTIGDRALAEHLAVEDIRMAADLFRRVYDDSDGANGFVSLEVSPESAHDHAATVTEARRLWRLVSRPNVMIKVPATPAGMQAVEALTAEGINVNITLMFSLAHYEAVVQAYLRGLARNPAPGRVVSVASIFVSRLDAAADRLLEQIGSPEALALQGCVAIANARRIYARFREVFSGDHFARLQRRGARIQRLLWASTGTKNPAQSDVRYVEALVGPDTITTVPLDTLAAFRHHGRPRITLHNDDREAAAILERAAGVGLDLHAITGRLQADGIEAFDTSFRHLLATLAQKRSAAAASDTKDTKGTTGTKISF
jgi:transaldolase